jgi:hypothetical protein
MISKKLKISTGEGLNIRNRQNKVNTQVENAAPCLHLSLNAALNRAAAESPLKLRVYGRV